MKVDIDLLDKAIEDAGLSKESFARSIGMDLSTFYRKRQSNFEKLTVGEMHLAVEILNMSPKLASRIFLLQNLQ